MPFIITNLFINLIINPLIPLLTTILIHTQLTDLSLFSILYHRKISLSSSQALITIFILSYSIIYMNITNTITLNQYNVQRHKNLGSRVALLPGKFLRVWKVFARITEKILLNCHNTFKTIQIFPDDFQFSG